LTKQAESELGSDQLYPESEAEAKKSQECGSRSELGSMTLQEDPEAEAKTILLLPHPWF